MDIAGKDFFTEVEAAHYACVSESQFLMLKTVYKLSGPKYAKTDIAEMIECAIANPDRHNKLIATFRANEDGAWLSARTLRTPIWANLEEMESIYAKAKALTKETGIEHQVDHIIPLRGGLVSGLHVTSNLRIITASENAKKHNKYEIS